MSYAEAVAELIPGLEAALDTAINARQDALNMNIWGSEGESAIGLSFDLVLESIKTRLDLAKAAQERV